MIESPSTPQEVAKILGVNRAKIASFISSGQLKAADLSLPGAKRPRYRILPHDLAAFLDSRTTSTPKQKRKKSSTSQAEEIHVPEYV